MGVIIFRTVLLYAIVVSAFKLMGKREIGELNVLDLIVFILIAELVAIGIEENKETIWNTIMPILILVCLQISFAYLSLKSKKVRNIMEGKPTVIIFEGKLKFKNMVKERYNINDLLMQLREKEIKNIEEVEYAMLEPNGSLSIFKKKKVKSKELPLPLITDGKIETGTLKELNKDESWVHEMLKKEEVPLEKIFYAFLKSQKIYIIKKNELL